MCRAITFYVPVERRGLPATDPKRWMILPITAIGPFHAIKQAERIAGELRLTGVAIWAAVRDLPSFSSMQQLRDDLDASRVRIPRSQRFAQHDAYLSAGAAA